MPTQSRLKLFDENQSTARWKINGHPAEICIWTNEEYAELEPKPTDAQRVGNHWAALRML